MSSQQTNTAPEVRQDGAHEPTTTVLSRLELIKLLNEDLAREFQQEHQIDLVTALGEDAHFATAPVASHWNGLNWELA
jgi:hypothetical protein